MASLVFLSRHIPPMLVSDLYVTHTQVNILLLFIIYWELIDQECFMHGRDLDTNAENVPSENLSEKKKKKKQKKQKKAQESDRNTGTDQTVSAVEEKKDPDSATEQVQTDAKSSQVRTFPNGLVIEEIAMGKPDGRRASPGKQVLFVH